MKKLLVFTVLGLLWSGSANSDTIKDMTLACSLEEHIIMSLGEAKEWPKEELYDISIKNNKASLISSTLFDYKNFILKEISDEEYYFINENNDDKLFARIKIDRIRATALVVHMDDKTRYPPFSELIQLKNCKLRDNKPKF